MPVQNLSMTLKGKICKSVNNVETIEEIIPYSKVQIKENPGIKDCHSTNTLEEQLYVFSLSFP